MFYKDYVWKKGIPQGIGSGAGDYKIVMDPYRKHISVEKYQAGMFSHVVYDSVFLNFRKLSPQDQQAWQKEVVEEEKGKVVSFIRNQEDRTILVETQTFIDGRCHECHLSSPHGIFISKHIMYQGAPFTGVILYDAENRPVMGKKYETDQSGNFTKLLYEEWDGEKLQGWINA